ncbi:U-box domain-containing protein 4 [Rhynchospora pubera]|uniref:U-box domain-containing protein 4 n=1 Tax=Rhynchospora pubera TaxID=906938 RepID=A0AAV8E0K8_9POAL|nr:U-box domain-containing protein 4 [Rhynchospora pubera]
MEVKLRTVRSLVRRLSEATDEPSIAAAVAETWLMSKHDSEIRLPLAEAGAVPLLSKHLRAGSMASSSIQEDAAASLLNLSIAARESLMSTPGLIDALGNALKLPNMAAQHAAATLYSLLCVDSYRPIIGSKRPILSSLISLLKSPVSTRSTKDALKALFGVSLYPLNRPTLVDLGAVSALFSLIVKDGRSGIVEDVTAVIAQIAGCGESVDAFRKVAGVRVLVDLIEPMTGASERSRENAAAALLNLVTAGGERAAGDLREVGGAEDTVIEMARDDSTSARGKTKAEALVKVLESVKRIGRHDSWMSGSFDEDEDDHRPSPPTSASSFSMSQSSISHGWS